jgi:hypothetical protein
VASWKSKRVAYWREGFGDDQSDQDEEFPPDDDAKLKAADDIVIWVGTSLAEQIALAWLPAYLRALDVDPGRLKMIQFYRSERGFEVVNLGIMSPEQLAKHPAPASLTPRDLEELRTVWGALTASEPDALMAYLATTSSRLPFLKRALRSIVCRYPDASSGLGAKEMTLLQQIRAHGPRLPRVIADTLVAHHDAVDAGTGGLDQVGDLWLFERLLRLGDPALPEPALTITGTRTEYRNTEARLTSFGERVLDGKANFLDANGIDDWVAGVHLNSAAGRVWVHDGGQLIRR